MLEFSIILFSAISRFENSTSLIPIEHLGQYDYFYDEIGEYDYYL